MKLSKIMNITSLVILLNKMQIKEFYLDLKEWPQYGKKQKDIRVLESEAFKEPLKFTFQFDSKDKREMDQIKADCKEYLDKLILANQRFDEQLNQIKEKEEMITKSYQRYEELNDKYEDLLERVKKREEKVNKKIFDDNNQLEGINQKIEGIKKEISLPEPQKIYTNTRDEFVVWLDVYYGYPYLLPHWEYIVIEQYEYEPQNEYVANENKIQIKSMYLSWKYIPEIQLEWLNAIDKPVSKVRLTVLFFQI